MACEVIESTHTNRPRAHTAPHAGRPFFLRKRRCRRLAVAPSRNRLPVRGRVWSPGRLSHLPLESRNCPDRATTGCAPRGQELAGNTGRIVIMDVHDDRRGDYVKSPTAVAAYSRLRPRRTCPGCSSHAVAAQAVTFHLISYSGLVYIENCILDLGLDQ